MFDYLIEQRAVGRPVSNKDLRRKGLTVTLVASGSGEKLPAMIIFKEQGGQLSSHSLYPGLMPAKMVG